MSLHCSRPFLQVLSDLMAEMRAVLELHSGPAVLEAAARTYLSLCGEETAGCSTARAARDSVVQHWVDQLTALLDDSFKVGGTLKVCCRFLVIIPPSCHKPRRLEFAGTQSSRATMYVKKKRALPYTMTCFVLFLCCRVTVCLLTRRKQEKFQPC